MPTLLIVSFLSIMTANAYVSEGFLRERNKSITLEKPVDSRIAPPSLRPCSPESLKKYINVYVHLEWVQDTKKNCYITKKVVPKVYDPLKSSRITK